MKRLHQGHLHPKLEVPRQTCPVKESNPGLSGGRRASQTAYLIAIQYLYMAVPVHVAVTHGLMQGVQARM
jgi:hypothetical protein